MKRYLLLFSLLSIAPCFGSKPKAKKVKVEALPPQERLFMLHEGYRIELSPKVLQGITAFEKVGCFNAKESCSISELPKLNLSSNGLTSLPAGTEALTNLQDLSLEDNQFTKVPRELAQLGLQRLVMDANRLVHVGPTLCGMTTLTSLHLDNNRLESLPRKIHNLGRLINLVVSHNNLTVLPDEMGALIALQVLIASNNEISGFPFGGINLAHCLRHLDLSRNRFTEIPDPLFHLVKLTFLNLSHNQLTAVPEPIGCLRALEELSLEHNAITKLPPNIRSLGQLKFLRLSHNRLTELPDTLCRLTKLERLFVAHNELTQLPENWSTLSALKELYISNNQLDSLPESLGTLKLEVLSLENNNFPRWLYVILALSEKGTVLP